MTMATRRNAEKRGFTTALDTSVIPERSYGRSTCMYRLAAVPVGMEIARDGIPRLTRSSQPLQRIYRAALRAYLEMQMWWQVWVRRTDEPHHLALAYNCSLLNAKAAQRSVH